MADFSFEGQNGGVTAAQDNGGMVFDLSSVEEPKGFEVLPKGTYDAIVDDMEYTESKNGDAMMKVQYAITGGEFDKRMLFDYWMFEGKGVDFGLAKLKSFLVRVCPEVDITHFNPQEFAEQATAVGVACRLKIGIKTQKTGEYKGEKRNTILEVLAPETNSFL